MSENSAVKEEFLISKVKHFQKLANQIIAQAEMTQQKRDEMDKLPLGDGVIHVRTYADSNVKFHHLKISHRGNLLVNSHLVGHGGINSEVGWFSFEVPKFEVGTQVLELELEVQENTALEPFKGVARTQILKGKTFFNRKSEEQEFNSVAVVASLRRINLVSSELELSLETFQLPPVGVLK